MQRNLLRFADEGLFLRLFNCLIKLRTFYLKHEKLFLSSCYYLGVKITIQFSVSNIHNSYFEITLLKILFQRYCCKGTVLGPT